ncbi:MAG: hypothetical protein ACTHJR_08635 [Sphingomonas sp.]
MAGFIAWRIGQPDHAHRFIASSLFAPRCCRAFRRIGTVTIIT